MHPPGLERPPRRSRHITVMVVPHSSQAPWSLRIPRLLIEVACAVIGLAGIALLLFTNAYQRMTGNMEELVQLRETTREQRTRIDDLNRRAAEVQENLLELEDLERQVRELLDLPPADAADPDGREGASSLGTARPLARIAQLAPPTARGGTRRPLAPVGEPEPAGVGGPVPLLSETINLGGLADLTAPHFEPTGEAEAAAAREDFASARTHSGDLLNRLARLRLEATDKLAYLAAKPSVWPAYGPVTSEFGARHNPFGFGSEFHAGLDIGAPYGSPIVAAGDGVVTYADWHSGYGRKVEISHGYGLVTVYAHASELAVDVGEQVETGQVIGWVGSSGRSTGAHLHYEVWVNGRLTDPWEFLP